MARVFQITNIGDGSVRVAYCVDMSVGNGCANKREDVLLVQHLLRLAWRDAPNSKGFRPPGETKPLEADGMFGPTTQRFIKHFQEEAKRRGANVTQDQRVDPVLSGTAFGAVSKSFYTILAMNSARNSRQISNQADIAKDPDFPGELAKWFYVNWD